MITLKFNGKDDISIKSYSKRRVSAILSLDKYKDGHISGSGKVRYLPGYTNEFEFSSMDDLKEKLWPCLEKELVDAQLQKV